MVDNWNVRWLTWPGKQGWLVAEYAGRMWALLQLDGGSCAFTANLVGNGSSYPGDHGDRTAGISCMFLSVWPFDCGWLPDVRPLMFKVKTWVNCCSIYSSTELQNPVTNIARSRDVVNKKVIHGISAFEHLNWSTNLT